jgi:putative DNA primase/helicase
MTATKFFPEALFENGFTDLVSVIPPGAQLTPTSRIPQMQIGKIPGRVLPNGLWAGYDWRKHKATLEEVHTWALANANVGLRADHYPGVDIDVLDEALAQIIQDAAVARLGGAPVRTGKPPKKLLMYRTDVPFGRMRLLFEREGHSYMVEILGEGQQYLIHGIHPATLLPYTWDEDLTEQRPTSLTTITREQADNFLRELAESLAMLGMNKIERSGDGHTSTHAAGEQESLRAPSLDILRQAVRTIPNTNALFPNRDDYIRMGYAIRAAGAKDLDDAYTIFAEWATKWEGNGRASRNDPETVLSDWRRFRPPFSVGWGWVAEQAKGFGFDSAALDFDVVVLPPDEIVKSAPLFSDQDLADRVVVRQVGNLRFVPQKNQFLAWDGGTWQPDAELLAEDIIKRELRVIANEVLLRGATAAEMKANQQRAEGICSSAKVGAVAALVRSDRAIAVSLNALDHDLWKLNTPAGIVDLTTGNLSPPDPDALCTKSTGVAPDFSGHCPRWLKFLHEATNGDTDLVGYLQRLCGYALTGSTREQQLTFIFGPGGNGKGVFLAALSGIFGDYSRTASMDTFTASYNEKHSTDVAMLTGARLVTASETEAGKRWDEQRLKSLTGGDLVSARFMRQDNFTFQPQFKLVFIGNNKPEVRNVDDAMRRRIQMVPFEVKPKRVDKELGNKLRTEWPAILAWMIQGCLDWQDTGLSIPTIVQTSTEQYFTDEDAVGRWMRECLKLDSPSSLVTSQSLYLSWKEWANRNGEYVGSLKRLSAALMVRNLKRGQDPKTRKLGFIGIELKETDALEALI